MASTSSRWGEVYSRIRAKFPRRARSSNDRRHVSTPVAAAATRSAVVARGSIADKITTACHRLRKCPVVVPFAVMQVAVLEAGRVGTPAELLARDGAYAALAA